MEETPLFSILRHKMIKPESAHQPINHNSNHCSTSMRDETKKDTNPSPALQPRQVSFRLLCRVHIAGGVIGSSGSVIKHLENLTETKIRVEKGLPNCHERVINIMGDAAIEKKISVLGGSEDAGSEDEEMVEVSKAQYGLIRVFERVLEVEGNGGNESEIINSNSKGLIGCRLLAATGQIGAVVGKGGKIVDGIRKNSGAKITVLKEHIPACAAPKEELIQISGGVVAVKKALLGVSRCLQDCTLREGKQGQKSSHGVSRDSHEDIILNNSLDSPTLSGNAVDYHSVGHSLPADIDKKRSLDEDSTVVKVVFRFLCSNGSAGGVIGKGANIVKSLEKETGASIKFSSLVSGLKERVATISSLENPNPLYSPAQIAIIRVFSRSVEVSLDRGLMRGLGKGENATARILVAREQISCLVDDGRRVASDISTASSVEIQLLGADLIPNYTAEDDKVVQIIGEYENVKSALFQVTSRLRENYFSRMGLKGAEHRCSLDLVTPSSGPSGRVVDSSSQSEQLSRQSSVEQLGHLGFVHKSIRPLSTGLRQKNASSRRGFTRSEDGAGGLTTFPGGFSNKSMVADEVPIQTVEVLVPQHVFGSVYGENGSNLIRLKEISGATFRVIDPSPGENKGKVIICGAPEQIRIAQSLLQAFILM